MVVCGAGLRMQLCFVEGKFWNGFEGVRLEQEKR